MLIAAVADVFSPRYYMEFLKALEDFNQKPDLFIIAGDVVYQNNFEEYVKIKNALMGKIFCPIIATIGNNEEEIEDKLKEEIKEIRFLNDQSIILTINYREVGIFASIGIVDEPTSYMRKKYANPEMLMEQRAIKMHKNLIRLKTRYRILVTHFAPTFKTLEGENPAFYKQLGSLKAEKIIIETKPDLVIHATATRGKKFAWVDTVPVFNVSFPLNKEIVLIDTEELKPGLEKFV